MSSMNDIDNKEPFFLFDPYEGSSSSESPHRTAQNAGISDQPLNMSSQHPSASEGLNGMELSEGSGKGKGVTKPMPIRPSTTAIYDVFDMSGSVPTTSHRDSRFSLVSSPLNPSSFSFLSTPVDDYAASSSSMGDAMERLIASSMEDTPSSDDEPVTRGGKGKEKELPPTLPPLSFSPSEFGYDKAVWPSPGIISQMSGPSSYESTNDMIMSANADSPSPQVPTVPTIAPVSSLGDTSSAEAIPILTRMPSRRHSFSHFSIHSTQSIAARSLTKAKVKLPTRLPSNLARKFLFRARSPPDTCPAETTADPFSVSLGGIASQADDNTVEAKMSAAQVLSMLNYGNIQDGLQYAPASCLCHAPSKGKGRSNSAPLPFSMLDYVPATSTDIFTPIPLIIRNHFDEMLPKELRLHVLHALVALHEEEHQRSVSEGHWTVAKASSWKGQWVGREKGVRELFRLSRVSKSWETLVFDGQLWTDLNLRSFPWIPKSVLLRLTKMGGSFIKNLDVAGHIQLLPVTLLDMADSLCLSVSKDSVPCTQLTNINLQGCSALTTRSLHHLLIHSPSLQKLNAKGLGAVTNTTCDILATYCTQLMSLDLSRCSNMDGNGIQSLASAAIARGDFLPLKALRLCGLKYANDMMMATLGKAAPHLEVLDLSYARQLHNSAIDAFVACESDQPGVETIMLPAREIGRPVGSLTQYRRRVTRLRHLSLSSCVLLTDIACANLAHSVPRLEFLEMASIGAELKDEGLIRLLNTTPYIRRLDLEDATAISDSLLATITPGPDVTATMDEDTVNNETAATRPEPGHALQQLIISHANDVTDDALLSLMRGCKRLSTLEVDNTRIGSDTLRELIRLSRKRKMLNAKIVAIDCRGIGESIVKSLAPSTRPRMGWRSFEARKLKYLDGRDESMEDLKIGQDECDETRVVLKTFYSWQTVDAVRAARESRRKATTRRTANESTTDFEDISDRTTRWWSPGGRRSSGTGTGRNSPLTITDTGEGCRVM